MTDQDNTDLSQNLFFLSSAFARKLSAQADDAFATLGLSSSHALILLLVYHEPEIQPSSLSKKLYLKPSTITRLVQKLENRGLVDRRSEGRSTLIVCTNEGAQSAEKINSIWSELLDQKKEELGERYVEVLSEMISNAIGTIDQ